MIQIKTLTDLRQIVNEDKPNCLYCGRHCSYTNNTVVDSTNFHSIEIYRCDSCRESVNYFVFLLDDSVWSAAVTCNEYEISLYDDHILLRKGITSSKAKLPLITLDFSNKEKLCEKLSIYLTFS